MPRKGGQEKEDVMDKDSQEFQKLVGKLSDEYKTTSEKIAFIDGISLGMKRAKEIFITEEVIQ